MPKKRVVKKKHAAKKAHKASSKKEHKTVHTESSISHRASHIGASNTEKILIENFVSLQKVMVNLSVKFDNLSNQISRLLDLFEISAKALAKKGVEVGGGEKELAEKIDNLLEQNKVLARGVALMHERGTGQELQPSVMQKQQPPRLPPVTPARTRVVEQTQDIGNAQEQSAQKFKPLPRE